MKLHFDPNQQYQIDAVTSIVDIFDGQPLSQGDFGFSISENGQFFNENGVGNRIVISKEQILNNLRNVQKKTGSAIFLKNWRGCIFPGRIPILPVFKKFTL